ncbi:helix-turn-helix transcriptional regulator [Paenibacillus sp. MBLB4367]|uniref:helix-turn-helix transcriptional regulator n=1 Tax=Paenibacillus sp. MBLB4367 TaxID=3384767 RepID=UPI0039082CCF
MTTLRWMANRGFLKIFTALLLIVIIMFVSNYMVYKKSLSGIYDQVSENNRLVVKNTIRVFDESFKDINDIIYSIQSLPYITWKITESSLGTEDLHEVYLMRTEISKIVTRVDYIEEVVVFHNNSDLAITTAGTIHLKDLFRLKFSNQMYNSEFWMSFGRNTHTSKIFPSQWYGQWNSETGAINEKLRKLLVVASGNQIYNHNVLVFLNVDKLLQHVNQSAMMQGTSLVVLDQERNAILSTEESLDLINVLSELNGKTGQEVTLKKTGNEYNLYKSDFNGFTYVNKVPYQFADMKPVSEANRRIIMIAIIFAVILSGVLSLYLYKPMRVIFKLMGGRDPREIDFRRISSGIVKLREENEAFKARMEEMDADMVKSAFLNTLENRVQSQEAEFRMRRRFTEEFKESYFMLAAFHFKRAGESNEAGSLDPGYTTDAIRDGLQAEVGYNAVFHAGRETFLAVIGVVSSAERENAVRRLRSYVKHAEKDVWNDFSMLVVVSRLYPSKIEHCSKAYRDVTEGLSYRNVGAEGPVIDVQAIRYTWRVYFPLDEVEKLSHFLASGNERECIRIIDDIFAKNAERRIHHHQLIPAAKMMFYDMLKLLDSNDADPKEIMQAETAFLEKTASAFRHEDIRDALVQAAKGIAESAKREAKSKLNAASIAKYIDSHYMDNLHLDHMAEQMETSPKYFSNYFKKTFGVNFVDYINKVRLSHAKELLRSTDLSVAEIGEKTGYLNSSTFTTTFKKYYGISPSEYRRNVSGEYLQSGGKTK